MKDLIAFTSSFCVCIGIISCINILIPSGKNSKAVKFTVNLTIILLLIGLISAVIKTDFTVKVPRDTAVNSEISSTVSKMVIEIALEDNGINFKKIKVNTDNSEDGNISISKVTVYSSDNKERIKKILGDGKNFEVDVINE